MGHVSFTEIAKSARAGHLNQAREYARVLTKSSPTDTAAWSALAEICAALDDFDGTASALAHYLQIFRARSLPPADFASRIFDDHPEVDLRMRQLRVAMDGHDRHQCRALIEALRKFDFFVPPPMQPDNELGPSKALLARLGHFQRLYGDQPGILSLWQDWIQEDAIEHFRSESVYLSQACAYGGDVFGSKRLIDSFERAYAQAAANDALGALRLVEEDGAFGCLRFRVGDGVVVSKDQICSVSEINFIARHCDFGVDETVQLIDIGAGYGRLVHRFLTVFPNATAFALDAVPFSSFICEQYLRYRGLVHRAVVGGPNELDHVPRRGIRVASNVATWGEAPLASITKWIELLVRNDVEFLFFIPHGLPPTSLELDRSHLPILPEIAKAGYRLVAQEGWMMMFKLMP